MNILNIIGKPVYAVYEGEFVGTVLRVNFSTDILKVSSLTIFDNEDNEFELPFFNIKKLCDCVLITNKNKLLTIFKTQYNHILQKNVIDENAKVFEKIVDVEIDEVGKVLNLIMLNNKKISPSNVVVQKDFVYISNKKIKLSNYKPKQKSINLKQIKVNILNNETTNFMPQKTKPNTQAIIGKITKKDLFGLNNELIIKANQPITEKTVLEAKKHNRLNQLFYISN